MKNLHERDLTRGDIDRWIRNGKSIKAGDVWYTVFRSSKRKEAVMLVTSEWETAKGKKSNSKIVTYDDLLKNVNSGNWMVKINDKPVGATAAESTATAPCEVGDIVKLGMKPSFEKTGKHTIKPGATSSLLQERKKILYSKTLKAIVQADTRITETAASAINVSMESDIEMALRSGKKFADAESVFKYIRLSVNRNAAIRTFKKVWKQLVQRGYLEKKESAEDWAKRVRNNEKITLYWTWMYS